jgi:predicted metal-dependent TIM-barrel fold hydrolase
VWFDASLHPGSLAPRDVQDLAFFGVAGALVLPEAPASASAAAVREGWEAGAAAARRLRRAGLAAVSAAGLGPRAIPLRGLEALLADLPHALDLPEVGALGVIGLDAGGELEERVLLRQLELARELRLPVVAAAASRHGRERLTRRLLALLRDAELEPGRALVLGADARSVKAIRACGHLAVLPLSGGGGDRGDPIDAAVALVRALGPEGIALGSDAGLAGGDLLAVPRAADRLARAGLSAPVVRRVCGGNARAFLALR